MRTRILPHLAFVHRLCAAVAIVACFASAPAWAGFGDQLFKLTASDSSNAPLGDWFGNSVGISGNVAIVGASPQGAGVNLPLIPPGSAYLYDTATGHELGRLVASESVPHDGFGQAVAISGNTAIVGAMHTQYAGRSTGSAYLFDVATGQERWQLNASDAAAGLFGESVAISGDKAIVGAFASNDGSGSAYLFDVTTGQQLFKLTASDAGEVQYFGGSVAISGNVAIVGSINRFEPVPGAAYVFDVLTGEQLHKLTASDGVVEDFFGTSVAIDGNIALVGASDGSDGSGAAYVFDVTTGQELRKFSAIDGAENDSFGGSVAISGNIAIVGALGDDDTGEQSGSAYVFDVTTGQELKKITVTDAVAFSLFGSSVAISGETAIAGMPGPRPCCQVARPPGTAYVFDVSRNQTVSGDFNVDGAVDAADYTVWRNGLGTTYTQTDYYKWRANFGRSYSNSASTPDYFPSSYSNIPEPTTRMLMAVLVPLLIAALRERYRQPISSSCGKSS